MNKKLLDKLVCPVCKGPLEHRSRFWKRAEGSLVCHACSLVYPVVNGIPRLNTQDAHGLDEAQTGKPGED